MVRSSRQAKKARQSSMKLRSTRPKKLAKSVHFTAVAEDALRKLRQDNLRAAYAEYSEKISAQGKAPRGFVQALAAVYGQNGQLFTYADLKNFIQVMEKKGWEKNPFREFIVCPDKKGFKVLRRLLQVK